MDLLPLKVLCIPYSISNILALIDVTSKFIDTMDTNNKNPMFVHTGPDYVLKFYQCRRVLYCFNNSVPNVLNNSANA